MPLPPGEPTTSQAVSEWITAQLAVRDPFRQVYEASERHRQEHGCDVYPTGTGPLLGALAAGTRTRRALELGCGLGYSALWLARGVAPDGRVETIERDAGHTELAKRHFAEHGCAERITVHVGSGRDVLPRLVGPYDFLFVDSDIDEYLDDLEHFVRLLRSGGLLATSNLFLARYSPDIPGLEVAAEYRRRILGDPRLLTAFAGGLAISVRR